MMFLGEISMCRPIPNDVLARAHSLDDIALALGVSDASSGYFEPIGIPTAEQWGCLEAALDVPGDSSDVRLQSFEATLTLLAYFQTEGNLDEPNLVTPAEINRYAELYTRLYGGDPSIYRDLVMERLESLWGLLTYVGDFAPSCR